MTKACVRISPLGLRSLPCLRSYHLQECASHDAVNIGPEEPRILAPRPFSSRYPYFRVH